MSDHLECKFPKLKQENFEITSEATRDYNCIAWAADDTSKPWWPIRIMPYPAKQYYWPRNLPRVRTLDNFVQAFALLGYETCSTSELEQGYVKVAIYVNANGAPTHMARQLESGAWTSKLGDDEDIEHSTLASVEGAAYGKAHTFLKRPRK